MQKLLDLVEKHLGTEWLGVTDWLRDTNSLDAIESRIRAVVAGRYPYVIMASGERVAPGGQIDGKVLAAIGAQEIVFADGLRLRLHP